MNRYWFRVEIDSKTHKRVKVLIQAPNHDLATKILKKYVDEYYPGYPDFKVLNRRDILDEESCFVVIGDGESMHYSTYMEDK